MNFLQGELVDGTFACPEGRFATAVAESRENVTAGLRPEDCQVTAPARARSPRGSTPWSSSATIPWSPASAERPR